MNLFPAHLIGAYIHFRDSLLRHHGMTISPVRYLRLCLEAADTPGARAQGNRLYLEVRISGRLVNCIYDPRGTGALVTVLHPPATVPRHTRARQDHRMQGGKRRKFHARRGRPYKRPKNPEWR